jgi:hypothetical protein
MQCKPEQAISCGGSHTTAVTVDGTVVCWGDNKYGQCSVPSSLEQVIAVSCGEYHTVARLLFDGRVACWGGPTSEVRTVLDTLKDVIMVSAGDTHSAAVTQEGMVVCWGDEESRQSICMPPVLESVVIGSCGCDHTVVLTQEGSVISWGDNSDQNVVQGGNDALTSVPVVSHAVSLQVSMAISTPLVSLPLLSTNSTTLAFSSPQPVSHIAVSNLGSTVFAGSSFASIISLFRPSNSLEMISYNDVCLPFSLRPSTRLSDSYSAMPSIGHSLSFRSTVVSESLSLPVSVMASFSGSISNPVGSSSIKLSFGSTSLSRELSGGQSTTQSVAESRSFISFDSARSTVSLLGSTSFSRYPASFSAPASQFGSGSFFHSENSMTSSSLGSVLSVHLSRASSVQTFSTLSAPSSAPSSLSSEMVTSTHSFAVSTHSSFSFSGLKSGSSVSVFSQLSAQSTEFSFSSIRQSLSTPVSRLASSAVLFPSTSTALSTSATPPQVSASLFSNSLCYSQVRSMQSGSRVFSALSSSGSRTSSSTTASLEMSSQQLSVAGASSNQPFSSSGVASTSTTNAGSFSFIISRPVGCLSTSVSTSLPPSISAAATSSSPSSVPSASNLVSRESSIMFTSRPVQSQHFSQTTESVRQSSGSKPTSVRSLLVSGVSISFSHLSSIPASSSLLSASTVVMSAVSAPTSGVVSRSSTILSEELSLKQSGPTSGFIASGVPLTLAVSSGVPLSALSTLSVPSFLSTSASMSGSTSESIVVTSTGSGSYLSTKQSQASSTVSSSVFQSLLSLSTSSSISLLSTKQSLPSSTAFSKQSPSLPAVSVSVSVQSSIPSRSSPGLSTVSNAQGLSVFTSVVGVPTAAPTAAPMAAPTAAPRGN